MDWPAENRRLSVARFAALLFTGLAMVPTLAHLFELANKIGLSRDEYLVVQQIYRGWALFGFVIFAALAATLAHAVLARRERREFALALVAFLCLVATQVVFWTFTFPTNQETQNWTVLPEHWAALRAQWEYSHAASAVLNIVAFVSLALAASVRE